SDMAKLALFMFLARLLSTKQHVIQDLRKGFLKVLTPVLLTCILIAPANLSTALMLGFTCCILFFIGRVKVKHILLLVLTGVLSVGVISIASKITGNGSAETWEKRVESFIGSKEKPLDDKRDDEFQVTQAKIAIARGGIFGQGPGHSQAKDYLPH